MAVWGVRRARTNPLPESGVLSPGRMCRGSRAESLTDCAGPPPCRSRCNRSRRSALRHAACVSPGGTQRQALELPCQHAAQRRRHQHPQCIHATGQYGAIDDEVLHVQAPTTGPDGRWQRMPDRPGQTYRLSSAGDSASYCPSRLDHTARWRCTGVKHVPGQQG